MRVAYRATILFERAETEDITKQEDDLEWQEIVRYGLGSPLTSINERMSTNLKHLLRSVKITAATIELEDLIKLNIEWLESRGTDLVEEEHDDRA